MKWFDRQIQSGMALRRHPDAKARAAWYGAVIALPALAFVYGPTRHSVVGLWIAINLLLNFIAVIWAFFHPRSIRSARQPAARWAFIGSLFGAMWLLTNLENRVTQYIDKSLILPSAAITYMVLILTPFVFLTAYLLGMWSAAVVAFCLRKRPVVQAERAVALSIAVTWVSGGVFYALGLPFGAETVGLTGTATTGFVAAFQDLSFALQWGSALTVLWLTLYWQRVTERPRPFPARLIRAVSDSLILRFRWRGGVRSRDLRGAALGLLAALFALALGQTNLLAPLQTVTLNSLLHLQGALREDTESKSGSNGIVSIHVNAVPEKDAAKNALSDRIVLLTMDAQTRRLALSSRSESALQSDMIRLLDGYGATRIVLPVPELDKDHPPPDKYPLTPQPTAQDIARSDQDLRYLLRVMRESGHVIAARRDTPGRRSTPDERRVQYAASATIPALLSTYGMQRLPLIPAQWTKETPGALLLFAAAKNIPNPRPDRSDSRFLHFAGEAFPLALDNAILADFGSMETGRRIARLDYAEILSREPLCLRTAGANPEKTGAWTNPAQFFRGKIVFLDGLTQVTQETSIGKMTAMEAQARAAYALFTGSLVTSPRPLWPLIALLALGAFVGHRGFRRNPLDAGWRMALPLLTLLTVYIIGICVFRCWLDPVVPALAVLFAFLLTTQATYAVEQDEGGRARVLLERFVAPQLLEELLADPRSLGLGGKMQQVCVLFADVRNFTGFTENRDPQEVIGVINQYMTALTDAMYAHNGIFDKYTGDGLMAFFRITDSAAESPQIQQAVTAAQAMQEAALAISAQRVLAGQPPLGIGIGLHYGEAVVGMVGSPSLANYTALGHTVVISARLQSIAAGGEIVLSESVFSRTVGLRVEAGELVQIKGVSAPVRPYRLRALSALAIGSAD